MAASICDVIYVTMATMEANQTPKETHYMCQISYQSDELC